MWDFISSSNEGYPNDHIVTLRTKSVETMVKNIKSKRFMLVKGTPFSGKTGFIDLLVANLQPQAILRHWEIQQFWACIQQPQQDE